MAEEDEAVIRAKISALKNVLALKKNGTRESHTNSGRSSLTSATTLRSSGRSFSHPQGRGRGRGRSRGRSPADFSNWTQKPHRNLSLVRDDISRSSSPAPASSTTYSRQLLRSSPSQQPRGVPSGQAAGLPSESQGADLRYSVSSAKSRRRAMTCDLGQYCMECAPSPTINSITLLWLTIVRKTWAVVFCRSISCSRHQKESYSRFYLESPP